ncbi:MAG: hypothetical protein ACK5RC_03175 [Curvibacter sp.]|jgi:hypothetical protein|nr:hypothetical protein [Curvibacter sp.]
MSIPSRTPPDGEGTDTRAQAWLPMVLKALAAAAGLKYGFDFGMVLGGVLLGVIVALNAAVFCYLMTTSLVDLLQRRPRGHAGASASAQEQTEDHRIHP